MLFVKCADCIRTKERNCSASHPDNPVSGCFCGATEGTKPEQVGKRCVECGHFTRCKSIFGVKADSECDFYPSRFVSRKERYHEPT